MLPGGHRVPVVGESYYQDNLARLCGGRTKEGHSYECVAILRPEPTNPYDPNAVAVCIDGLQIGHLSREAAKAFAPVADVLVGRLAACSAVVRGGWDRGGGDEGAFGVVLDLGGIDDCRSAVLRAN
jgi:hypothetical protein